MLKIIDFGLAKKSGATNGSSMILGTLEFIAPEVFEADEEEDPYDAPCDIWAAGLICFQLLAGRNPMKKNNSEDTKQAILGNIIIRE